MDDIALDYDPRNAPVSFGVGAFMPGGYGPGSFGAPPLGGMVGPRRPPINYGQTPTRWVAVPARQPAPAPTYPYGYPPGGYYPVPVPVAVVAAAFKVAMHKLIGAPSKKGSAFFTPLRLIVTVLSFFGK